MRITGKSKPTEAYIARTAKHASAAPSAAPASGAVAVDGQFVVVWDDTKTYASKKSWQNGQYKRAKRHAQIRGLSSAERTAAATDANKTAGEMWDAHHGTSV